MDSLTEKLCSFISQMSFDRLPAAAVHETKRRLLDAYSCSLGAWEADPPKIARQLAGEVTTSGGSATVWGTRHRTTPDLAAFAELDFWPRLMVETHRRAIPMLLINSRMPSFTERSGDMVV